jgi:hypothetical protein
MTFRRTMTRNRWLCLLGVFAFVSLVFAIAMFRISDFLTNVGFLVCGALLSMTTVLLSDRIKRPMQARELARALYVELADRVARCCFDCEAPWNAYLDPNFNKLGDMDSFRLRKFSPIEPVIYLATASEIAVLEGGAPQALIQFYYRLAAWQRDIENIAAESETKDAGVPPNAIRLLATRVHQTLAPGLRALEALAPLVDDSKQIESSAIAGYDEFRCGTPPSVSLRDRIGKLIGKHSS